MQAFLYGAIRTDYIDGNKWVLKQNHGSPFYVRVTDGDNYWTIKPPDGFVFDFLSIPWYARWLIPKTGGNDGSGRASVPHDLLYSHPGYGGTPANQKFADDVFLACLEAGNVKRWKCLLMYRAVRVGGARVYGNAEELSRMRSK